MRIESYEIEKCLTDLDYLVNKFYQNVKYCMAPYKAVCSEEIISAHTISKKYLKNICNSDKKVYITKVSSHNPTSLLDYELGSIRRASCFSGFCGHHDRKLFTSFENNIFKGTHEQIYDISFRALCRKYFQKKVLLNFIKQLKTDYNFMSKTEYVESTEYQNKLATVQKEVNNHKNLYDAFLKYRKIKRNTRGLAYMVIETSKLPIAATGVLFPLYNILGDKIQDQNRAQQGFVYNLVPLERTSVFIISFMMPTKNNIHQEYLMPFFDFINYEKDFLNYILTSIFYNNDNIAITPDWYNNLSLNFKEELNSLMNLQAKKHGSSLIHKNINFTDHLHSVDCKILKEHFSTT